MTKKRLLVFILTLLTLISVGYIFADDGPEGCDCSCTGINNCVYATNFNGCGGLLADNSHLCAFGYRCNAEGNACIPEEFAINNLPCNGDNDCSFIARTEDSGYRCLNNRCKKVGECGFGCGCYNPNACDGVTWNGNNYACSESSSVTHIGCAPDYSCQETNGIGSCVQEPECRTDNECNSGFVCDNGECVGAGSGGIVEAQMPGNIGAECEDNSICTTPDAYCSPARVCQLPDGSDCIRDRDCDGVNFGGGCYYTNSGEETGVCRSRYSWVGSCGGYPFSCNKAHTSCSSADPRIPSQTCADNYYCTGSNPSSCVHKKNLGLSCQHNYECSSDYCNNGICALQETPSVQSGADGSDCFADGDCASENCYITPTNYQGTCISNDYWIGGCGRLTSSCSSNGLKCNRFFAEDRICADRYYCGSLEGSLSCIHKKDDDASCNNNFECFSNLCEGGVCGSTAENINPTADVVCPTTAYVNSWVTCTASQSRDPDGTIISYSWRFGATASPVTGSNLINLPYRLTLSGRQIVTLLVTDNDGGISLDSAVINVLERLPNSCISDSQCLDPNQPRCQRAETNVNLGTCVSCDGVCTNSCDIDLNCAPDERCNSGSCIEIDNDLDDDGLNNGADTDDDNDGILDVDDNDDDNDGIVDTLDTDDDNDGVLDINDPDNGGSGTSGTGGGTSSGGGTSGSSGGGSDRSRSGNGDSGCLFCSTGSDCIGETYSDQDTALSCCLGSCQETIYSSVGGGNYVFNYECVDLDNDGIVERMRTVCSDALNQESCTEDNKITSEADLIAAGVNSGREQDGYCTVSEKEEEVPAFGMIGLFLALGSIILFYLKRK